MKNFSFINNVGLITTEPHEDLYSAMERVDQDYWILVYEDQLMVRTISLCSMTPAQQRVFNSLLGNGYRLKVVPYEKA